VVSVPQGAICAQVEMDPAIGARGPLQGWQRDARLCWLIQLVPESAPFLLRSIAADRCVCLHPAHNHKIGEGEQRKHVIELYTCIHIQPV